MTLLLPRCANCRRHLRPGSSPCPFCVRRSPANLKSAALAASLMAFGHVGGARADEPPPTGEVLMPSEHAAPAQVEPHYGIPPRPRPPDSPPEEEPEPPNDDEEPE